MKKMPTEYKQPTVLREVNASQFNLSESLENNAQNLQNALDFCKENSINRLVIGKGVYYFNITEPILLSNMQNFELYAKDARFVFYSPITSKESIVYFKIVNCDTVKITGLSIDWDVKKAPLASLVKVVSRADTYVDFECMEDREIPETSVFITTNAVNDKTFTPGVEGGREYNINGNSAETFLKREKIGEKTYRCYQDIKNLSPLFFNPGTYHLIRHFMYNGGAFSLSGSKHITFENVTLYAVPGFGIHVHGHSSHFWFNGFKITLPDFEKRYITATADGIHICQSDGNFKFENCDLGYQGDDCINIHDNVILVQERKSDREFVISTTSNFPCDKGDCIELRRADLSPFGFFSTVEQVEICGKERIVTVKDPLPASLAYGCVAYNRAYNSAHYEIRNCAFHETRARGILAQASDGMIENCKFYNIQGAAIQIESGASPLWSEGTGVDNLVIRNNEMINCDINDWDKGVLYMSTFLPAGIPIKNTKFANETTTVGDSGADFRTAYPMFTNITIENNLFKEYPRRAMILTSFDGVTLKNNTFKNEVPREFNNPERGSVWAAYGKNLKDKNNIFEPSPYMNMPKIENDC